MVKATKLRVVGGKAQAYVTPRATRHSLPVGAPCPNCGTALAGPWCYACGQKGEEFHRSIWRLVAEALEGLTHFDGRLWTTLPRLVARPAKLTRDFLDGHRAPQVPPFRMFLVVLLIVFFTGALNFKSTSQALRLATPNDPAVQKALPQEIRNHLQLDFGSSPTEKWFEHRVTSAVANQEAFFTAVERWSHQFAILMLPIAALLLSGLFAFRRGVFVFDHLIFAMHSLSFQGLLLSTYFLLGMVSGAAGWLLLAAPVHLFVHMRGVYRTGVLGTLARMTLLFAGSAVAFSALITGLVIVGLAGVA